MQFDYSKLRGRIKEKVGTETYMAEKLKLSRASFSQRLNNKIEFSQEEIKVIGDLLEIPPTQLTDYFFTEKV